MEPAVGIKIALDSKAASKLIQLSKPIVRHTVVLGVMLCPIVGTTGLIAYGLNSQMVENRIHARQCDIRSQEIKLELRKLDYKERKLDVRPQEIKLELRKLDYKERKLDYKGRKLDVRPQEIKLELQKLDFEALNHKYNLRQAFKVNEKMVTEIFEPNK